MAERERLRQSLLADAGRGDLLKTIIDRVEPRLNGLRFAMYATRYQYMEGVADTALASPDGSTLDDFYLARPGAHDVQLSLFTDYGANVALYLKFQE